jgi:hypothetical protein
MMDNNRGVVSDGFAACGQPPNKVDIFACSKLWVEAVDRSDV